MNTSRETAVHIGDIKIQPVFDGSTWELASDMLARPGVADPWSCHPGVVDQHGRLNFEVGGFLIRTGERVILVDTGLGTIDKGHHRGGRFLKSLASHGVDPADVTDVLFTHLHYDHVGWATQQGRVVFPRATYRVHAADWAHFVESPQSLKGAIRKLSPLRKQLEPFDADGPLAPGVDVQHTPGHTPGSSVYIVSSGDQRALLLGDTVHTVAELAERDWIGLVDIDPDEASKSRNAIADEVADTTDLVAAAHFTGLRFGRVITAQGRRAFHFV
jgi:glyoxylase-like metal-dependent hydrolase (beta-lactamase superfamily II)